MNPLSYPSQPSLTHLTTHKRNGISPLNHPLQPSPFHLTIPCRDGISPLNYPLQPSPSHLTTYYRNGMHPLGYPLQPSPTKTGNIPTPPICEFSGTGDRHHQDIRHAIALLPLLFRRDIPSKSRR